MTKNISSRVEVNIIYPNSPVQYGSETGLKSDFGIFYVSIRALALYVGYISRKNSCILRVKTQEMISIISPWIDTKRTRANLVRFWRRLDIVETHVI